VVLHARPVTLLHAAAEFVGGISQDELGEDLPLPFGERVASYFDPVLQIGENRGKIVMIFGAFEANEMHSVFDVVQYLEMARGVGTEPGDRGEQSVYIVGFGTA
jgi:hypothetical protein